MPSAQTRLRVQKIYHFCLESVAPFKTKERSPILGSPKTHNLSVLLELSLFLLTQHCERTLTTTLDGPGMEMYIRVSSRSSPMLGGLNRSEDNLQPSKTPQITDQGLEFFQLPTPNGTGPRQGEPPLYCTSHSAPLS